MQSFVNRTLAVVVILVIAIFALVAVSTEAARTTPAVSLAHSPRVCRSAATWGPAPDRYRPCARISAVEEDGSVQIEVSDADGTVRYTTGVGALDR